MSQINTRKITWEIKPFDELTTRELHDILKIRVDVFVVEQNCAYHEIDNNDIPSYHLLAKAGSKIIGTARIVPEGIIYDEISIGRIAIEKEYRGKGVGRILMKKSMDFCKTQLRAKAIKLAGQLYLKEFYEAFGFRQVSAIYPWDGIDHLDMLWEE